jgi:hypothetical protein
VAVAAHAVHADGALVLCCYGYLQEFELAGVGRVRVNCTRWADLETTAQLQLPPALKPLDAAALLLLHSSLAP